MFLDKYKKILIYGLGKSGISMISLLNSFDVSSDLFDTNAKLIKLDDKYQYNEIYSDIKDIDVASYDLLLISPGIDLKSELYQKFIAHDKLVIGEVELAFRLSKAKFVSITGTNGKTTTVSWLYDCVKRQIQKSYLCGNVGIPICDIVREHDDENALYIAELSSYQLETTIEYRSVLSGILNLTPDHLQRHGDMANYLLCKLKIAKSIANSPNFILGTDDKYLELLSKTLDSASSFSLSDKNSTVFLKNNSVYFREKHGDEFLFSKEDVFLKGEHNLKNAMAMALFAKKLNIEQKHILASVSEFKGVAHRNEFVANIDGVYYYNDSKATNPEASIPALKSFDENIHLICGGMDKESDFSNFIAEFKNVKEAYIFGECSSKLSKALSDANFNNWNIYKDLKQAFDASSKNSKKGEVVLLSPACASWDMYKNFEERGNEFKSYVLGGNHDR